MNFNLDPQINVNIQGKCVNWLDLNKTYNIIRLLPYKVGTKNILTQTMMLEPNTKYIVHYNFDLNNQTVRIPEDCILEIDGGNISNGTLIGNNTILLNTNGVDVLQNVTIDGTWKTATSPIDGEDITYSSDLKYVFADKHYDASAFSGLGRVYLRKNIKESVTLTNLFYSVLGDDNFRYIFCVYNNEFYYIYDSGAGLVLSGTRVYETYDYRPSNVPNFIVKSLSYEKDGNAFKVIGPDGEEVATLGNNTTTISAYTDHQFDTFISLKNVLEANVFAYPNTRYIIQYDFDLNSKTITLPENCYLDFLGGSLSNGKLKTFDKTIVISFLEKNKILHNVELLYPENFDFEVFNEEKFITNTQYQEDKNHFVILENIRINMEDLNPKPNTTYVLKNKTITISFGTQNILFDAVVLEEVPDVDYYICWKALDSTYTAPLPYKEGDTIQMIDLSQNQIILPIEWTTQYDLKYWELETDPSKTYNINATYTVNGNDAVTSGNHKVITFVAKWAPASVTMYSFPTPQTGINFTGGIETILLKDVETNVGKTLRNLLYHYIKSNVPIQIVEELFTGEIVELGYYSGGVYRIDNLELLDMLIKYI